MSETRIAIYIRLSNADGETGKGRDESNSVVNQRSLINHFLDGHPELSGCPRTEFVDDGFTGTNMERPAFQRMIAAIREGKFNCCITKDFSRFARDYIEMGDYLEYLFPFLKVRYISINDGYDSRDYRGTTGGLDVVMRAIIYDAYSKDLSVKVKTGKQQGSKKGRRVGGYPGYGYIRDPKRKGMDIIDPEAAVVVRRIFDAAIQGMTLGKIAQALNDDGIPTPGVYFKQKHPDCRKFAHVSAKQYWSRDIVRSILKRYTYTGAAVSGTIRKVMPCKKSIVMTKFEEWVIVPGMHDAIVTPDEYEIAQKVIQKDKHIVRNAPSHPLKSLVICGNCLRAMSWNRRDGVHRCQYGANGGDEGCRGIRSPKEDEFEEIVLHAIQDCMNTVSIRKNELRQTMLNTQRNTKVSHISLDEEERRLESLKYKKFTEYERYASGQVTKEIYLSQKKALDAEISQCEAEIQSIQKELETKAAEKLAIPPELDDMCEIFHGEDSLTYDMAHAFLERILVYPKNRIEIQWKFRDCFATVGDG